VAGDRCRLNLFCAADLEGDSYTVIHAWAKPCTKKASNNVFETETYQ
jgi:hypothetical protein